MRICHVITRLIIGGAQENTLLSCRGLAERGHQVTLIAGPETGPEGSLWDQARSSTYQSVTIKPLRRAVNPLFDLWALAAIKKLFRRLRPEVVHTHSSKAGILARAAAVGAGVPIIVHTIHGMSFNRTQMRLTNAFYRRLERRAARHTSALVAVADAMIEQSLAAGIAPRERFVTIRSGMETEFFTPDPAARVRVRAAWGLSQEEIVVGTIARLFQNKGYEQVLGALPVMAKGNPQLRFVWVGDGAHRPEYERQLRELGLGDRVRFLGLVPPHAIGTCINGFDIVLHASQWEGLPRAVVQGLLMEIPAVSFDNDGAPEVVHEGETGFLVPLGDTEQLAESVLRLADDSELRRKLGQEGRRRCLRDFDWRTMVTRIEELYLRLCSAESARAVRK